MLPWLIELGLGAVDLGVAATAIALLADHLANRVSPRRRRCLRSDEPETAPDSDEPG